MSGILVFSHHLDLVEITVSGTIGDSETDDDLFLYCGEHLYLR